MSSVDHVSASLWDPVDCNVSDEVGIVAQLVPKLAPSLSGDDGLHILLLAPCEEVTVGDGSWPEMQWIFVRLVV